MTQIVNASGNIGALRSAVGIVLLVDSNGNAINSLTGSGVQGSTVNSINNAAGALTLGSNNANYTFSTNGNTISLNTFGSALNPVDGPLTSTNNGIATWSGVAGSSLLNSSATVIGNSLFSPILTATNANINGLISGNTGTFSSNVTFGGNIIPLSSGTEKIGTANFPLSGVYGAPILTDVNGGLWKISVSTIGVLSAVSWS